jgi:hypothetical protein
MSSSKVVRMITLARTRMAGEVGSHGDPERQRGEELVGEVDAVLNGGNGGAGELHGIMAKLLEVMAWLKKGRSELTTASRTTAEWSDGVLSGEEAEEVKYGRKSGYK